jgi:hypothetical protein
MTFIKNNKLEKKFNPSMKKTIDMKKSSKKGIILSIIVLFSMSLILTPLNGYAEEINVKSIGVEKTSIITFTNNGINDVKTFRIWLSQDTSFQSFKTEKGWIGDKNAQGVIVFSSSEPIKESESVKFGIKTDKPNPSINWKGVDGNNAVIDTGVITTSKIENVNQNPEIDLDNSTIDTDGKIFSDSTFRIIPDKPNPGSTIRVVGQNFGALQLFDFHIDAKKIGSFQTDDKGSFITTMKIPENGIQDRVDFKIKNYQGEEKILSLRIGNYENRITDSINSKITTEGIKNIVNRGDGLELFGTGSPGTSVIIEIKDPNQKIINSRTAKVDGTGNWKLESQINIPFDIPFGKYSVTTSDGRNQNLKYLSIESDKIIIINPTETMFEVGEVIKFNGTAVPSKLIEFVLEDHLGNEKFSDIKEVNESGYVELEYKTTENDDVEGTWTLVATQNGIKEFTYVGYGENPNIPINLEFNKMNYNTSDKAIISLIGKPSDVLKMMIINPTGSIDGKDIVIKLQEDGRGTYELELTGYTSGIYTAVIQKGNSQSSEKFSVGLQMSSGPIDVKTTQTNYNQGERILVIGSTNPNSLLKISLVDPNGVTMKSLEIPSNSEGSFTVDKLKIPSNAMSGKWKVEVKSGSNLDKAEFEVNSTVSGGIVVNIGKFIEIPGFGDSVNIEIIANQKTSITMKVFDLSNNQVSESLSCTPTAEFKCQILWTIPKDLLPGTYTIQVSDSINTVEKSIIIK